MAHVLELVHHESQKVARADADAGEAAPDCCSFDVLRSGVHELVAVRAQSLLRIPAVPDPLCSERLGVQSENAGDVATAE